MGRTQLVIARTLVPAAATGTAPSPCYNRRVLWEAPLARLTFISDLHLSPAPDGTWERFLELAARLAERARAGAEQRLLVVGDLFSFWVDRPLVAGIFRRPLEALRELVDAGCPVTLLEGNRDFDFGPLLVRLTGAGAPGERLVLERDGRRVLVMHGDQLLTADRRYQLFKRLVRSWPARLLARGLPSPLLLWAVRRLERVSESEKAHKDSAVMLPDPAAVARELESAGAEVLVHGHTHQSGESELEAGGRRCRIFCLGEWDGSGGALLDWPAGGEPRLVTWPAEGG